MALKTSKNFAFKTLGLTCEDLVEARIPFVEGVIYKTDLPDAEYVTPVRTFNGYAADCYVLKRTRSGFEPGPDGWSPVPVKTEYLLEPVAVIL